ncbi:hypothetical protein [Streptomyces chartreusis]
MGVQRDGSRDFAYYANDWIWPSGRAALMKSTLLFFDGIALSLPQDLADRMIETSPDLAQPLAEHGLLINLEPKAHLQPTTAAGLARGLREVIERIDHPEWRAANYGGLVRDHWGGVRAQLEADELSTLMLRRGLAAPMWGSRLPHEGGARFLRIAPAVRLLILNAYCQALRRDLQHHSDITLQPVAEVVRPYRDRHWQWGASLRALMQTAAQITPGSGFAAAEVVRADLRHLDVDLSHVPLDELLAFRADHRAELRSYIEGLRTFVHSATGLSAEQYESELRARRLRIDEEAAALKSETRKAFGRLTAATGLAIAGASWTATQGDVVGALLAGAAAAAAITRPLEPVTAYTYVLSAARI